MGRKCETCHKRWMLLLPCYRIDVASAVETDQTSEIPVIERWKVWFSLLQSEHHRSFSPASTVCLSIPQHARCHASGELVPAPFATCKNLIHYKKLKLWATINTCLLVRTSPRLPNISSTIFSFTKLPNRPVWDTSSCREVHSSPYPPVGHNCKYELLPLELIPIPLHCAARAHWSVGQLGLFTTV